MVLIRFRLYAETNKRVDINNAVLCICQYWYTLLDAPKYTATVKVGTHVMHTKTRALILDTVLIVAQTNTTTSESVEILGLAQLKSIWSWTFARKTFDWVGIMDEFELSYREVIPDQTNTQIRKDITINTGLYSLLGYVFDAYTFRVLNIDAFWFVCVFFSSILGAAQSTLQDIKVIEKAGGFCYSDLTHESKRNRFIYWYVVIAAKYKTFRVMPNGFS